MGKVPQNPNIFSHTKHFLLPFPYTKPAPPHLHHHRSDPPPPSLKLRSSSSPRLIGLPHFLFLPKTSKSRWFLVLLTASRHLLRFHLPSIIFFVFPASSTFNGGKGKASTFLAFFKSCFHFDECFLIFSFSFGSSETASTIMGDFRPFSGDDELDISKQLCVQVWVSYFLSISLLFYEIRREGG